MIKDLYETMRRFNAANLELRLGGADAEAVPVTDAAETKPLSLPAIVFTVDGVAPYEDQPAMPGARTFEATLVWTLLAATDDASRADVLDAADELLRRTAAAPAALADFSRPENAAPDAPPPLRFYTGAEFHRCGFNADREGSTRVTLFDVERKIIFQSLKNS